MDLKDFLHAVRTRWGHLLGGLLLGLLVAGALTWTTTPQYASSTRLFVSSTASATDAVLDGNQLSQQRMASYAQLISGETLAARVVDDLDLDLTPAELADQVSVRTAPDTVILDVAVTSTSPTGARDIAASLARQFVAQVDELETASGAIASPIRVSVVQPALLQRDAVSPDAARNLSLGAVLGLLLGLVVLLIRSRMDSAVRDRRDVATSANAELVGAVLDDPRLAARELVVVGDEPSASAEAIRAIGAGLQRLDAQQRPRVIVVGSAGAGEGRTMLAANLAVALGQTGMSVALVEADLRNPRMAVDLGLLDGAGLAEVLAWAAEWHEVAQPWGDGAVTVLTAGRAVVRPSELGGTRMRALLHELREAHDVVVVDTPPLLMATDAALVSVLADGCLVVARYGVTREEELAEAALTLSRVDAHLLGVVLNRVPRKVAVRAGYGFSSLPPAGRWLLPPTGRVRPDTGAADAGDVAPAPDERLGDPVPEEYEPDLPTRLHAGATSPASRAASGRSRRRSAGAGTEEPEGGTR
jgi:polysaccharide biosynthesis transport protein